MEALLDCVDKLSGGELESKYRIRSILVPRWANFLRAHCDRFSRYPEMIDHGSLHVSNVVSLAADMLCPLYERRDVEASGRLSAEELVVLLAAMFLHDIGMADIETPEVGFAQIRKRHGTHSRDMILNRRKEARQVRSKSIDLLPGLSEDEAQLIGLVCMYHQSKAPLTAEEARLLGNKSIAQSLEAELDARPNEVQCFGGKQVRVLHLAALLAFLDACDNQYSRSGSIWLTQAQVQTNERVIGESAELCRLLQPYQERDPGIASRLAREKERQRYFREQERAHYKRHSAFERIWILGDAVVAKLLDDSQLSLVQSAGLELKSPDWYFKNDDAECEDLTGLITKELERVSSYLEDILPPSSVPVNVRVFNPDKDIETISKLPHYRPFYRTFEATGAHISRACDRSVRNNIALSGAGQVTVVVGPPGCGKTETVARASLNQLQSGRRIQKGSPAGRHRVVRIGMNPLPSLEEVIDDLTMFLAANGDFPFFNKKRLEVSVEATQWDFLFERLRLGPYVLWFDDFNKVPMANERRDHTHFFKKLFEGVRGSECRVILSTTKAPAFLRETDVTVHYIEGFAGREVDEASEFVRRRAVKLARTAGTSLKHGERGNVQFPVDAVKAIVREFGMFPEVLSIVAEEISLCGQRCLQVGLEIDRQGAFFDECLACARIRAFRLLHSTVLERLGSKCAQQLLCDLLRRDAPFSKEVTDWAAQLHIDEDEATMAFEELRERGIVRSCSDGRWRVAESWRWVREAKGARSAG